MLGSRGWVVRVRAKGEGYNSGFCKDLLEAPTVSGSPWRLQRDDALLVKAGQLEMV